MKDKRVFLPAFLAMVAMLVTLFLIHDHQIHCPECFQLRSLSPDVIKHYILGFGPWALVIYIILYAVNTISLLPPIAIMSLAAGFIFGPLKGSVALMVGSFIGTTATFYISRCFGARYIDQIIKGKAREFQETLDRNGFKVIVFIRLIPILPWEVVNYAAGLSRIHYRDYILATMIGIFPSVLVQTFFSDRLARFNLKDPTVIAAIGAFLLLGAMPVIYLKMKGKK